MNQILNFTDMNKALDDALTEVINDSKNKQHYEKETPTIDVIGDYANDAELQEENFYRPNPDYRRTLIE